jgi:hypothetical protein
MKMMSWSRYHCLSGVLLRKPRKFSRRRVDVFSIRETKRVVRFTSPTGRGRRVAPGEGLQPTDRPYPLTPTLSPWERGCTWVAERLGSRLFRCISYFQFVIRLFRT